MRGSISGAAFAGVLLLSFATAASAQMGGGKTGPQGAAGVTASVASDVTVLTATCTVSSVNAASSSFVCASSASLSNTFQVTSTTVFALSVTGTSLGQLAAGMKVVVQYHMSGAVSMADRVMTAM